MRFKNGWIRMAKTEIYTLSLIIYLFWEEKTDNHIIDFAIGTMQADAKRTISILN